MGMVCCGLVAGTLVLLLGGTVWATELDRVREIDRTQEEQRAAIEAEFTDLSTREPDRIKRENGRVFRDGAELTLLLAGGRRTFFRDDESQCLEGVIPARNDGCVQFFFIGDRIERFYLLRARYAAGSDYRLIDEASGRMTKIADEPHFASDSTHFVVVSSAEANSTPGIEIWSTGAEAPMLEWAHVPTQYALYYFVDWEGDQDVAIEVATYVDHKLRHLPAHVLWRGNQWTLRGPIESSQY
jgi:hypothetical protein